MGESARFYSTFQGASRSPERVTEPDEGAPAPRSFLKKGSNIQKQIVVNLLRNKLLREREVREKREYSNSEIIRMIQVFKGVALEQTGRVAIRPSLEQGGLRGWESEGLEEDLH